MSKNNNNGMNNLGNNTTEKSNKTKKANKPKGYTGLVEGVKKLSSALRGPITRYLNVEGEGMVPVEEYRKELIAREEEKARQEKEIAETGVAFDEDGEPRYPILMLDDYLRGRYELKAAEFKKLQREQGFYFSDAIDEEMLKKARLNQGYFFKGVMPNSFADILKHYILAEPMYDTDGNLIPLDAPGDILLSGQSRRLLGEDINVDYDKSFKEQMGFHLGMDRSLKPEDHITEDSSFEQIIDESADYTGMSFKRVSPKSLLNLAQVLDKSKKTNGQWLRVATVLEVIYKYMSAGMTREGFFNRQLKLDPDSLQELEEFFRTDHLFMTLDELRAFKEDLEFYRAPENRPKPVPQNSLADLEV